MLLFVVFSIVISVPCLSTVGWTGLLRIGSVSRENPNCLFLTFQNSFWQKCP
ncbi:hypothetical protein PF008_g9608 [Phytophthora fragariae]|uniref:Uncharacterized protein n=1 Tax=Phytophthora fragariae TaxID=53985 RepID=A0A6G0RWB6_9STRA|nr:hypothetical protein PF008_g9608 [Phytophthora fragariae]